MRKQLNGEVVGDQDLWLYQFFEVPAFSPQTIRTAVEENPEGEDLVLEINSGGGSVFAGFEMYSVLRSAGCRTVAEVQSPGRFGGLCGHVRVPRGPCLPRWPR